MMYNVVVLNMLFSHIRCMCTNPGAARQYLAQDLQASMQLEFERLKADGLSSEMAARSTLVDLGGTCQAWGNTKWWCVECDTFRPRHTHHCKTCRCCVLEMDHHCPWVNNCIGWRNHKYFILFLSYAWIGSVWSCFSLACALYELPEPELSVADYMQKLPTTAFSAWLEARVRPLHRSQAAQLGCLLCCIVSFLMAIFISVMCCDQCEFMSQGYGVVDKKILAKASEGSQPMQHMHRSRQFTQRLSQVLGGNHSPGPRWFFPVPSASMDVAILPRDLSLRSQICETRSARSEATGATYLQSTSYLDD